MLGNDLFIIDNKAEISVNRLRSIMLFYYNLINKTSNDIYLYLISQTNNQQAKPFNTLLNHLVLTIDQFEKSLNILNKYKLINLYKKNNTYIIEVLNPLDIQQFINQKMLVGELIKIIGSNTYYQILCDNKISNTTYNQDDIIHLQEKFDINKEIKLDDTLINSNEDIILDHKYLDFKEKLLDLDEILLPKEDRKEYNLKIMFKYYNDYFLTFKQFKILLSKMYKQIDKFDAFVLLKLIQEKRYTILDFNKDDIYKNHPLAFLSYIQNGIEPSLNDLNLINILYNNYLLKPEVINVLLQYSLLKCDNKLITSYVTSIASDLKRNNLLYDYKLVKQFLNKKTFKSYNTKKTYNPNITILNDEVNENSSNASKDLKKLFDNLKDLDI